MLDLQRTAKPKTDPALIPPSAFRPGKYDTALSAYEEREFQRWLARQSQLLGRDLRMDLHDYDVRGLWLSLGQSGADLTPGHGPDTFKKPTHPTFSTDSKYSTPETPGGVWWDDSTFSPSSWMLQDPGRARYLQEYMRTYEPQIKLDYSLRNNPPAKGIGLAR